MREYIKKCIKHRVSIDDERQMFEVIFSQSGDKLWDIKPTTLREAIADARNAHDTTDDDDDDDSLTIRVSDYNEEYFGSFSASPRNLREIEERGFVDVELWI